MNFLKYFNFHHDFGNRKFGVNGTQTSEQNKNGDKNDRNLHANMLLKFVSPVVVKSILTGNDET